MLAESEAGETQPHTAHTNNPVPFLYVGKRQVSMQATGALCDISPTILALLGLPQPQEMTGRSLVEISESPGNTAFKRQA